MNNINIENNNSIRNNGSIIDMDMLIVRLKKEDSQNLKVLNNFKWIYLAMAVAYILTVFDQDQDIYRRIAGVCYVLAFALFALVFKKLHGEYRVVDYSVPLTVMLKKAVERYRFNLGRILLVLPSLLLIDLGNVLSGSFGIDSNSWKQVAIYQVVFFLIMSVFGFIGYLVWRSRQKPIHDSAKQMLNDLES